MSQGAHLLSPTTTTLPRVRRAHKGALSGSLEARGYVNEWEPIHTVIDALREMLRGGVYRIPGMSSRPHDSDAPQENQNGAQSAEQRPAKPTRFRMTPGKPLPPYSARTHGRYRFAGQRFQNDFANVRLLGRHQAASALPGITTSANCRTVTVATRAHSTLLVGSKRPPASSRHVHGSRRRTLRTGPFRLYREQAFSEPTV